MKKILILIFAFLALAALTSINKKDAFADLKETPCQQNCNVNPRKNCTYVYNNEATICGRHENKEEQE